MAKIEDLIKNIADLQLREEITREVAAIKAAKKFGLVFEQHIPEQLQVPSLPIKPGVRVIKRAGKNNEVFRVLSPAGKTKFNIAREPDGTEETALGRDLVVLKKFGEPIYPTLRPLGCVTRAPAKPYHVLIKADNFHALQLLEYTYAGQVDVIYIDPPYNTGARDWKYNNDYVDINDQWRHSKWLAMMRRRLLLAKKLLKRDGLLVIAIDDNEMHHLRCLLAEADLFGESNFIGTVVIRSKPSGNQTRDELAVSHEYALFVSASQQGQIHTVQRSEKQISRFDQEDEDGRYYWENLRRHGANSRRQDRPGLFYPFWVSKDGKIAVPDCQWDKAKRLWVTRTPPKGITEVYPLRGEEERVWAYAPDRARKELQHLVARQIDDEWQIHRKVRMRRQGVLPQTIWVDKQYSATEYGTNILKSILGESDTFSYPKSIYTVMDCIRAATSNPNALILDFFAGSGTTLQSVCLLNAEDGGERRCILVTNNEVSEKEAMQLTTQGLQPGDAEYERNGICDAVTWPRSKFAINGQRDDGTPLPGRYLNGQEMSDGFDENMEYFQLDFLDPDEVAYGEQFEAIVPILWLMAGAQGERQAVEDSRSWHIPSNSPFAVLLDETMFAGFRREIRKRADITHVFLVTDSERAYREMIAELPDTLHTRMLYKNYLENFRINTEKNL